VVEIKLLRAISEALLLNAYSVEQAGILDGKAGISLTLFELSHYLNGFRTSIVTDKWVWKG
jgi:hypothetical protein